MRRSRKSVERGVEGSSGRGWRREAVVGPGILGNGGGKGFGSDGGCALGGRTFSSSSRR